MSFADILIEDLIPHRGRMKLVDKILSIDAETARTASVVTGLWPLNEEGLLEPLIFVELVAQTAGVHEGWLARKEGEGGTKGWLVGVKNADFFAGAVPPGMTLTTTVRALYALQGYAVFTGTVESDATLLAQVEIQVFRPEEEL